MKNCTLVFFVSPEFCTTYKKKDLVIDSKIFSLVLQSYVDFNKLVLTLKVIIVIHVIIVIITIIIIIVIITAVLII